MPDIREEINDVLNLSRMINGDATHVNSKVNRDLQVPIIDPRKLVGGLIEQAKQSGVNAAPPQTYIPTPVAQVKTIDGVLVSAPIGLIPIPEGYNIPINNQISAPAIQTAPLVPAQVVAVQPISQQLEFDLQPSKGFDPKNEFLEIKHILTIINNKVTELVEMERAKYERRNKRKKVGTGSEGSGQLLPIETE